MNNYNGTMWMNEHTNEVLDYETWQRMGYTFPEMTENLFQVIKNPEGEWIKSGEWIVII